MRLVKWVAWGVLAFALLTGPRMEAAEGGAGKINLRVLYVGAAGSEREGDFVGFLEKHFATVAKADQDKFRGEAAAASDVVILDYQRPKSGPIQVEFGPAYSRPTITIGIPGANIAKGLNLKTAYG